MYRVHATTTRDEFRALAAEHRVVPVTRKVLADSETPLSAYRKLAAGRPGTFLLESAENGRSWSRWSFIVQWNTPTGQRVLREAKCTPSVILL
jgi:anthranilate/para-aminobenzoate synthase component I